MRAPADAAIRLADDYSHTVDERPRHELAVAEKIALDRHPVAVYLARLAPSSRRTMRAALDAMASQHTRGRGRALASLDAARRSKKDGRQLGLGRGVDGRMAWSVDQLRNTTVFFVDHGYSRWIHP